MHSIACLRMSERSDRLRTAMKRAKLSQRDAVERFGWNRNTLKSNLNGAIDFGYDRARVYGARLKVRAEWLYAGDGEMAEPGARARRPAIEVPVISWVSAGHLAEVGQLDDVEELERITISGLPAGDYFVLEVNGDSMDRVSPDGSRIVVRHDRSRPMPGGFYVFAEHGETTFKRYYDDPVVRFEPFSTNPANRIIFPQREWEVIGQVVRSYIDLDRG